jgi:NADPH-dependent 2,4-dienoyl-CoA reductase/sulfur reductase-like enzyme
MDRVVIVGASAAGLAGAETLRREGFGGGIVLLGDEAHLPYDRPPLSKQVITGAWASDRVFLRTEEHLQQLGAEWRLGVSAVGLDLNRRMVAISGGTAIPFDGLIVATGVSPRRLATARTPAGVHVLKTLDDAIAIRAALSRSERLVVIGAGFLGSEVAAAAAQAGRGVTLVDPLAVPMERQLGPEVGAMVGELHRGNGVTLRLGEGVQDLAEDDGRLTGVVLEGGEQIAADLVLVAIGSTPNVSWLQASGLAVGNGVECDEFCLAAPGIAAAGDAASWYHRGFEQRLRLEHRTNATEQGAAAARALLGMREAFEPLPYFWTDQYDVKIQMYGVAAGCTESAIVRGDPREGRFAAAFRRDGQVRAVLTWNLPRAALELRAELATELARAREQGISRPAPPASRSASSR